MYNYHLLFIKASSCGLQDENPGILSTIRLCSHPAYESVRLRHITGNTSDESQRILDYLPFISPQLSQYFYPTWLKLGLISWKIFALLDELPRYNQGDWILYHDYNYLKYPVYLDNFNTSPRFISSVQGHADIALFTEGYKPIGTDISKYHITMYRSLCCISNSVCGLWSGALAIRNNQAARDFLMSWATMVAPHNLLLPLLDHSMVGSPQMIAPEQSMLSLLYYCHKKLFKGYIAPKLITTNHRKIPSNHLHLFHYRLINRASRLKCQLKYLCR